MDNRVAAAALRLLTFDTEGVGDDTRDLLEESPEPKAARREAVDETDGRKIHPETTVALLPNVNTNITASFRGY